MGKFITLREEFESETGAHPFADQHYIEWLEKVVEKQRQVKNCSIPFVGRSEQLKALEDLKDFAYDNCQPHNSDRLAEIIERL